MKYTKLTLALLTAYSFGGSTFGMDKPIETEKLDRKLPLIIETLCNHNFHNNLHKYHCEELRKFSHAARNPDSPFKKARVTDYGLDDVLCHVKNFGRETNLSEQTTHQLVALTKRAINGQSLHLDPKLDWEQERANQQETNQQLPKIIQTICHSDLDKYHCTQLREFYHAAHNPVSPFKKAREATNGWDDIHFYVKKLGKDNKLSEQTTHQLAALTKRAINGQALPTNPELDWKQERANQQETNQQLPKIIQTICHSDLDEYHCTQLREFYLAARNPVSPFKKAREATNGRDDIQYNVTNLGEKNNLSEQTIHQQITHTKRAINGQSLHLDPKIDWKQEKTNKERINQQLSVRDLCTNDLDGVYCRRLRQIHYRAHNPDSLYEDPLDYDRDQDVKTYIKELGRNHKISKTTIAELITAFKEDLKPRTQFKQAE